MFAKTGVLLSESFAEKGRSVCIVVLASVLISLFAKISIPLPFTPVPLATQGVLILILSCLLGGKKAAAAVGGFLAQGAAGLPVFAGGVGGIACLMGPTGGYIAGYFIAAFVIGTLAEKMTDRSPLRIFKLLAFGNLLFFLIGVPYLAFFVGLKKALWMGFFPFILGDLLKLFGAIKLLQWLGWTKQI